MKRKLFALLLSAAMIFTLTACGSDELTNAIIDVGLEMAADALTDDKDVGIIGGADGPTEIIIATPEVESESDETDPGTTDGSGESLYEDLPSIDEYGTYNSAEDVSLYLYTYGYLPENFITKNEARELGWEGGNVEDYAGEGYAIGGDKFGNKEGLLPKADVRQYYECDIDTVGKNSRGAKRIVWSNDGLIYYTDDHYESFELLYGEE